MGRPRRDTRHRMAYRRIRALKRHIAPIGSGGDRPMPTKPPRRTRPGLTTVATRPTAAAATPPKAALSEPPATRQLRVFAFDPSLSTEMANYEVSEVLTRIPWERDRTYDVD